MNIFFRSEGVVWWIVTAQLETILSTFKLFRYMLRLQIVSL